MAVIVSCESTARAYCTVFSGFLAKNITLFHHCLISNRERLALIYFNPDGSRNSAILVFAGLVPKKKDTEMSTTGKKTTKSDSQPAISLEEIQKKIISDRMFAKILA